MLYDLIVLVLAIAQIVLPTRFAFLPLVVAGIHLGNAEVLPELTPARIIIVVGLIRAVASGGFRPLRINWLDKLFFAFGFILVGSTIGHTSDEWTPSPFNARAGLTLNFLGAYFYGRVYLSDTTAIRRYIQILPILLVPLSLLMSLEKTRQRNFYFAVGAVSEGVAMRDGKVRASGPFRHAILAGSAGATFLPFMLFLWATGRRTLGAIGIAASLLIVFTSASSGPLAVAILTLACFFCWRWRHHVKLALWILVGVAIFYSAVSGRAPWYLMAKIDLVGGSTGWHRAYLIDQGMKHLGEWWLWGTNYTRHWMPTGVSWNPNMTDITNYYLHIGVHSGFFAVIVLFSMIISSIRRLLAAMSRIRFSPTSQNLELMMGMMAVCVLGHAVSFISISYFDQMYIFFYLALASVPALLAAAEEEAKWLGEQPHDYTPENTFASRTA